MLKNIDAVSLEDDVPIAIFSSPGQQVFAITNAAIEFATSQKYMPPTFDYGAWVKDNSYMQTGDRFTLRHEAITMVVMHRKSSGTSAQPTFSTPRSEPNKDVQFGDSNSALINSFYHPVVQARQPGPRSGDLNFSEKPLQILQFWIQKWTSPGDFILELCAGTCGLLRATRYLYHTPYYILNSEVRSRFRLSVNIDLRDIQRLGFSFMQ